MDQGRQDGPHWIRLSCHRFRSNEVRLLLGVIACNLGNLLRRLALPVSIHSSSLTSLQQRLFKTGGRLIRHARYFTLQLAESYLTGSLFRQILGCIEIDCLRAARLDSRGVKAAINGVRLRNYLERRSVCGWGVRPVPTSRTSQDVGPRGRGQGGHSGRFPADGIAELELRGKNRRTTATPFRRIVESSVMSHATCRVTELEVTRLERGGS
jgi:Transposase DDE domain group 1